MILALMKWDKVVTPASWIRDIEIVRQGLDAAAVSWVIMHQRTYFFEQAGEVQRFAASIGYFCTSDNKVA
ncbi:hypothetical protein [Sphingomonas sp. Mn802worker]|uniref:hypothetical protein n=1 Tax=Sphingomonas sp. Mn802worker TaxID=629773 RepID=UPI0003608940|nr:hypothetical protein [Sphingomonas sp. Mn802worker]